VSAISPMIRLHFGVPDLLLNGSNFFRAISLVPAKSQ